MIITIPRYWFALFSFFEIISTASANKPRGSPRPAGNIDCGLFRSNDTVALTQGTSTYLEIGQIDIGNGFSISMDVLPSPLNHNGILLSIGTRPNFEYYEWKTKAIHSQFLVVEFIFSALALTVKALDTEHLQQIEVYRTYPTPYSIDDANWHTIKVYRDRENWRLFMDNINVTRAISNTTNVQLFGKTAFIGGRPSYTDHQFQGVIKNLRINGKHVPLALGKKSSSLVDVFSCSSSEAQFFMTWIKQSRMHSNTDLRFNN